MNIGKQFWMAACAALFVCGGTVTAQEADRAMPGRPERHYKPVPFSPEKSARYITDRMDSLLGLTKKQYDKLYKLNLKWAREDAENQAAAPRMEGRPEEAPDFGRTGGDEIARRPSARRYGSSSAPRFRTVRRQEEHGGTASEIGKTA